MFIKITPFYQLTTQLCNQSVLHSSFNNYKCIFGLEIIAAFFNFQINTWTTSGSFHVCRSLACSSLQTKNPKQLLNLIYQTALNLIYVDNFNVLLEVSEQLQTNHVHHFKTKIHWNNFKFHFICIMNIWLKRTQVELPPLVEDGSTHIQWLCFWTLFFLHTEFLTHRSSKTS